MFLAQSKVMSSSFYLNNIFYFVSAEYIAPGGIAPTSGEDCFCSIYSHHTLFFRFRWVVVDGETNYIQVGYRNCEQRSWNWIHIVAIRERQSDILCRNRKFSNRDFAIGLSPELSSGYALFSETNKPCNIKVKPLFENLVQWTTQTPIQ